MAWAKLKARKDPWDEEALLVNEEMRRVLCFFEWKAAWWLALGAQHCENSSSCDKGVIMYCNKQAAKLNNLALSFRALWLPYAAEGGLPEVSPCALIRLS